MYYTRYLGIIPGQLRSGNMLTWLCFSSKKFFKNGFRKTLVFPQYLLNDTNERKPSKAAEQNQEEYILKQLKYTLKKFVNKI